MELHVKKIIALTVTALFVFCASYGFVTSKVAFNDVVPIVSMIIGYYFGRGVKDDGDTKWHPTN